MLSPQEQITWKDNMKDEKLIEYRKILLSSLGEYYRDKGLILNVILIPLVLPFVDLPLPVFKTKLIEVVQELNSDIDLTD